MALTRATDKIIANADGNLNLSGIVTASSFSGPLVPSGDLNVGNNIKLGTASGIITATSFSGDGSNLTSLPAGLGTALSSTQTSPLNKLYYTNEILSIGATVTVDHPSTGTGAYTQYADLRLEEGADLIIEDGDDVIPDILGLGTDGGGLGAGGTGRIRVGSITNKNANGAPNFPNGLTGTAGTFTTGTFSGAITAASGTITGNLGVGGILTYEDVTNIDSVGLITARSGINISSGSLTIPDSIIHSGDTNTKIRFPEADTVTIETNGSERLRINSAGSWGIGASFGTTGQVLTSQGNSSAPTWATPSSITTAGGTMTLGFQDHVAGAVSSTTPTAYYQRIGNMVFCSCDTGAINLSGLNNGQILLVTGCFPITRDNNWTLAGSAYQYTVTSNQNSGGATIVPTMGYWLSNTSLYFVIPRVSSTSDNLTVGMCNSNNTRIFMQWHYKVN